MKILTGLALACCFFASSAVADDYVSKPDMPTSLDSWQEVLVFGCDTGTDDDSVVVEGLYISSDSSEMIGTKSLEKESETRLLQVHISRYTDTVSLDTIFVYVPERDMWRRFQFLVEDVSYREYRKTWEETLVTYDISRPRENCFER